MQTGATLNAEPAGPTGAIAIGAESDIVTSRQMVRKLTRQLMFTLVDQTKMITAASELSRNTLVYGGGGEMRWEIVQRDQQASSSPQTSSRVKWILRSPISFTIVVMKAMISSRPR